VDADRFYGEPDFRGWHLLRALLGGGADISCRFALNLSVVAVRRKAARHFFESNPTIL
jgi:hypothetical protein